MIVLIPCLSHQRHRSLDRAHRRQRVHDRLRLDAGAIRATGTGLGPFWIGCLAGIVRGSHRGLPDRPVPINIRRVRLRIFFSLFVFFNCFAINQWLQYKKVGRWADYLFGERVYVTLSLVPRACWLGRSRFHAGVYRRPLIVRLSLVSFSTAGPGRSELR